MKLETARRAKLGTALLAVLCVLTTLYSSPASAKTNYENQYPTVKNCDQQVETIERTTEGTSRLRLQWSGKCKAYYAEAVGDHYAAVFIEQRMGNGSFKLLFTGTVNNYFADPGVSKGYSKMTGRAYGYVRACVTTKNGKLCTQYYSFKR